MEVYIIVYITFYNYYTHLHVANNNYIQNLPSIFSGECRLRDEDGDTNGELILCLPSDPNAIMCTYKDAESNINFTVVTHITIITTLLCYT